MTGINTVTLQLAGRPSKLTVLRIIIPQRRYEINHLLFIVFASSIAGSHDAIPVFRLEGSAYLTPFSGGPNSNISSTIRWIRSPEPCNSDINNYTASKSLGGGSLVAGDTLLLTSDMRLLL